MVAASFGQAKLTFEAVRTSLELLGEIRDYRVRDQQNLADLQHRETKARLRVIGSITDGLTDSGSISASGTSRPSGDRGASCSRLRSGRRSGSEREPG